MKRKYALMPVFLIFCGLVSLLGAPADPGETPAAGAGIACSIRYYDKRVYYLEQDPVFVQISLTNNSPSTFRFKLADERAFSVDFDVRTTSNRAVEAADYLVRRRTRSQQVYFREISVEAGETFSFVEDLRNYAALNQAGSFVVKARFYPELNPAAETPGIDPGRTLAASGRPLESNTLSLNLRVRSMLTADGIPQELDADTNAVLVREKLPPDEVVSYLLTARQKSQWEKFFLYMDLETMLSRTGYRERQWKEASEEGRRQMLSRYRQDLQNTVTDEDISLIPMNFTIERTVYDARLAVVTVLEYFKTGNYIERKRFTWYLEKKDDIWTVVDYTVILLGTE